MRNIAFMGLMMMLVFLTACKPTTFNAKDLEQEISISAQTRFHELITPFQTFSQEQSPVIESDTELKFSFPQSALEGGGTLKHHKVFFQEAEKADTALQMAWTSHRAPLYEIPKSVALQIATLATGNKMYAQIQDAEVFFGEGSYETLLSNAVLKQIKNKRIELTSTKIVQLSFVANPRYDRIGKAIETLFFSELGNERVQTGKTYQAQITQLSEQYTQELNKLLGVLAPLGIKSNTGTLIRDSTGENQLTLSPQGKSLKLSFKQQTQSIILELFITPHNLEANISLIDPNSPKTHYPSLKFSLHPQANRYEFQITLTKQHRPTQQTPEWTLKGRREQEKTEEKKLTLNYKAIMKIQSLSLAEDQKLNIEREGKQVINAS